MHLCRRQKHWNGFIAYCSSVSRFQPLSTSPHLHLQMDGPTTATTMPASPHHLPSSPPSVISCGRCTQGDNGSSHGAATATASAATAVGACTGTGTREGQKQGLGSTNKGLGSTGVHATNFFETCTIFFHK